MDENSSDMSMEDRQEQAPEETPSAAAPPAAGEAAAEEPSQDPTATYDTASTTATANATATVDMPDQQQGPAKSHSTDEAAANSDNLGQTQEGSAHATGSVDTTGNVQSNVDAASGPSEVPAENFGMSVDSADATLANGNEQHQGTSEIPGVSDSAMEDASGTDAPQPAPQTSGLLAPNQDMQSASSTPQQQTSASELAAASIQAAKSPSADPYASTAMQPGSVSQEGTLHDTSFASLPGLGGMQNVPAVSTTVPLGSPSKPTPLASDPEVARHTANQLLQRKPQTLSRLQSLRRRIEKDRFDGEAWLELIQDALQKGDLERTREVFEGFLKNFPDNAREWIAYADLELSHGNSDRVNQIFGRCLRPSPSVQLWHFYLTYIRRTNPIDRSNMERALAARDIITKAFEFSLAHIGSDLEAGAIWYDYIEFLKEGDVAGTWEAQQKMDKLRQTYQRAVCIPLANVEQIWRDYDAFENNLNRATAKKFLQDRSPAYMNARAAARQLQDFFSRLSLPNVPHRPNFDSNLDSRQIEVWKSIIKYEESDPMELTDPAAIRTRVLLQYRKALSQLRFYPEIWYMAASYARSAGKPDEANAFCKAGMEANPTSLLIHYAYIEAQEGIGNFDECHKVYNGLIDRLNAEITQVNQTALAEVQEALEQKAQVEAQEKAMKAQSGFIHDEDEIGEDVRIRERENIRKAIIDSKQDQIEELKRLGANVWIMQMRFARRAEGIQQARGVFSKARKWPHISWQVFEASAMLELHWNKEPKIATNVFEVGMKRFSEEPGFVVRYLDFLITINDDGNARAVFEKAVTKIPVDKAKRLWKRWAEHEYLFGDLAAIQRLDARLAEHYPEDAPIDRFTDRHSYLNLDDIVYKELGRDDDDLGPAEKKEERSPTPPSMGLMQNPPMPGMGMPPPGAANMQMPMNANMPMNQQGPGPMDSWGRGRDMSPRRGPPSMDGSMDNDRRRMGGRNQQGLNNGRRGGRRSPSPQRNRGRRQPSPPRVSRHTPPDDFPEAIPWLLSLLPSKTVFAAHGPILDAQQVYQVIANIHLPPLPGGGRDRSRSPDRRRAGAMSGPGGNSGVGRRRSPDYSRRR